MHFSEVSFTRRLTQCACAIFWCLLSGGPIFGFAALKPILVKEHVYEYMCDISTQPGASQLQYGSLGEGFLNTFTNVMSSDDGIANCTPQDLKLNMMFTVAAVLTNVSALLIGRVLDFYGPRTCGLIGAFFLYIACFIFIFSSTLEKTFIDPYLLGYGSMALGGPFVYISSFQLSNSFPEKSGTILALITGAFDASSAVFLVYRIFYNATMGSFTLKKFFGVYLLVPTFICVAQIFVMPKESYKTETNICVEDQPQQAQETTALLENSQNRRRDSIGDALKQPYVEEGEASLVKHSGVFGILHGYSSKFQMKTPWFYLMCFFATIQMLRLNYFVATIQTQYSYLFNSAEKAENLNKFFDIALPLGGLIAVPFVGYFLDFFTTNIVLIVLLMVSLIIGVLGLSGNTIAAFMNVSLFVMYRPFFYTSVSDYCAKVFGFETFGTVYGAIICSSGIFNFSQSVLDKLTHTRFRMNPTPINVILVCLTAVIGAITVSYVSVQSRRYNGKNLR